MKYEQSIGDKLHWTKCTAGTREVTSAQLLDQLSCQFVLFIDLAIGMWGKTVVNIGEIWKKGENWTAWFSNSG